MELLFWYRKQFEITCCHFHLLGLIDIGNPDYVHVLMKIQFDKLKVEAKLFEDCFHTVRFFFRNELGIQRLFLFIYSNTKLGQ